MKAPPSNVSFQVLSQYPHDQLDVLDPTSRTTFLTDPPFPECHALFPSSGTPCSLPSLHSAGIHSGAPVTFLHVPLAIPQYRLCTLPARGEINRSGAFNIFTWQHCTDLAPHLHQPGLNSPTSLDRLGVYRNLWQPDSMGCGSTHVPCYG